MPSLKRSEFAVGPAFLVCAATVLWLACTGPVSGAIPCASDAYRQFDFWRGDWDVVDTDRPGVVIAHARVELMLNGCVLHEIYEAADGHKGESFTIYDISRNSWHQTWVTDAGYLLTIEGHLRDQAMILEGTDHLRDGRPRQVRGEWRVEGDSVHEVATRSTDGGATWALWFDLVFKAHMATPR
ncbi:MAG: hypothetical protein ABSD02_22225 [Steroidobacteraceae bacterium]|jgi:hypothetical protein